MTIVALAQGTVEGNTSGKDTIQLQKTTNDSITWDKTLDEVVISSQRQLVKSEADKLTYDVQGDEESKTKTIMEMLRKVPMVTVDGEDNIRVNGSSDFKIYKNGHPDPAMSKNPKEVLKSIPATMVKKIEVITEPGAKYDAEGTSAVLNIVMVDGSKFAGVTGSISGGISHVGHADGNGYIMTQLGKFVLSANYGMTHISSRGTENHSESENIYTASGSRLYSTAAGSNPGHVNYGELEASWEIDSLNLLTLSMEGYGYTIDVRGEGREDMYHADGSLSYGYNNRYWLPSYSYQDWGGRLDYQHKTRRPEEAFTFSYMLSTTNSHRDQETELSNMTNVPFNYSGYTVFSRERFYEHTLQADWVRPLAEHHKLETGLKYIYRLNKSETREEYQWIDETQAPVTPVGMTGRFNHITQVGAAYMEYLVNYNKWSARAGLRYEWSRLQGEYPDGNAENFHRNLSDWVPSASVNYKFNDANSLKMNYNVNIRRPGISYLNPAVRTSPTTIEFGNPHLSSSRSHNLSMTFMHIGPKLTYNLHPYITFANNWFTAVKYVKDDITYSTYDNVLKYYRFGLRGYAQWKPFEKTNVTLNVGINREHEKNPNQGYTLGSWYSDIYAQFTQQLPWKLKLTVSGGGQIGHDVASVYVLSGSYYWYGMNVQRSFLKDDQLTVRIGMEDPIGNEYHRYTTRTVQGDYTGYRNSWNKYKAFGIRVTWRFGKLKTSVKKTDTTITNDDVMGGIKKGN